MAIDDELVKVDLVDLWDGESATPDHLATILITVPRLVAPASALTRRIRTYVAAQRVKWRLKKLLRRQGRGLQIQRVCVEEKSIEIFVILGGSAVVLWHFFKDYKDFKEGVIAFVADVKAVSGNIRHIVDSTYDPVASLRVKRRRVARKSHASPRQSDADNESAAKRFWIAFLGLAATVAAGVFVYVLSSSIVSSLIGIFIPWSHHQPLVERVAQLGPGARAVYFSCDVISAAIGGFITGSLSPPPRAAWGFLTGVGSFLLTLWLATTYPDAFFVTPPILLDLVLIVVAATVGALFVVED